MVMTESGLRTIGMLGLVPFTSEQNYPQTFSYSSEGSLKIDHRDTSFAQPGVTRYHVELPSIQQGNTRFLVPDRNPSPPPCQISNGATDKVGIARLSVADNARCPATIPWIT